MTQPSLSEQLRKLEAEVGTPLFVRLPRRLVLTPAGEVFREHADKILNEVEVLKMRIGEVSADIGSEIRIGVLPSLGSQLFPRVIAEFRSKYPGIHLTLREENSSAGLQRLLSERELDIGVMRLSGKLVPHLEASYFLRERLEAIVPLKHPLARVGEVGLQDLAGESILTLKEGYGLRELMLSIFGETGITPNITVEVSQLEFLVGLVEAGMGVTILPQLATARERKVAKLQISDRHAMRELYIVWRRDLVLGNKAPLRTFVDILRSHATH